MKPRFQHVVVLMLENRSYDHLFGFLEKGLGVPPGAANTFKFDGNSREFMVRRGGDYTAVGEGPSHSLKQTNEQLFGKTKVGRDKPADQADMSGFVASFYTSLKYDLKREPTESELQQVMNCFDPIQLPVLSTLAREFVLCDHWFADVPGPTMPNRAFVHAATSQGYTYNANWKPAFTCHTIYDRLDAKNLSWRVYYHDQNDVLELYPKVKKSATHHVHFEANFLHDVANDNLPTYAFIDPAFMASAQHQVNSMHAPADVRPGEKLVADIYSALQANEAVWKKTLFVIVFDEHGGYFDHVVPPATVSPDGIDGRMDHDFLEPFDFKRLGLRVPCILVSPWFKPEVDSTVYSHASIPGSLIEAFSLGAALTERDKHANKLTKYLADDGTQLKWRTDVPTLEVPVQPQRIDAMQRELLAGSVYLDPHPELQNEIRTHDINDPGLAGNFIRTQVAKHIEHFTAADGNADLAARIRAPHIQATAAISSSRIAELRNSPKTPPAPVVRP